MASRRVLSFARAAAFCAALPFLLLASNGAQAQQATCGALMSGAISCADQDWTAGIIYEAGDAWGAGVAGDVAVTFAGGATTRTINAPAARTNPGWRNAAIVLRTSSGSGTSRDIALTVGTGSNRIAIAEHASQANMGIYIHQGSTGTDDTTVTLGSGVTIGSTSARMMSTGINMLILGAANTGTHTITSAAEIHATNFGINLLNRSDGEVVVTNSGTITTAATGGNANEKIGIRVTVDTPVDASTEPVTVTNSGTITVTAANAHGISVDATGARLHRIVNSGTIASGAGGHGIYVDGRRYKGTAGDGGVEIENSGTITSSGTSSNGIYVEASGNDNTGTDPITVTNSGDITAGSFVILVNSDQGPVTVTASEGELTSGNNFDGIAIQQNADADMTVTSGADITAGMRGIRVQVVPDGTDAATPTTGNISITTTGGSIEAESDGMDGIYAEDHAAHTGSVTVTNAASITAGRYGINADRKGAGAVSVTSSGGTVIGTTNSGIVAWNKADEATDVTVSVTGGTVRSMGKSTAAISAGNRGTGSVTVTIGAEGDAEAPTLNSMYNAGVYANLDHADNNAGQIKITQGGTIAARKGVYARAGRASASDETTRAAAAQPLIDVTWSGTFSHGTTADVSQDDMGRYVADTAARAVAFHQEVETEKAIRYGSPAGIEAQVMSWRDVMAAVAAGDAPAAVAADNAAQLLLVPNTATAADNAYVAAFRAALGNGDIDVSAVLTAVDSTATSLDDVTDAEIVTYLQTDDDDTRTLLRNLLAQGLSDAEKAVLRAVATDTGLDVALTEAGHTDDPADDSDYWSTVKALLMRHNVGNINVNMTGGSIAASRGDGIRAYYATPNDMNGAISVTVAEDASVTGGMAGVYVANAGAMGTGDTRILKQTVTVNGMVMGGSDAAVHLVGGGTLTVGATGMVVAGAGQPAILVNEPGRSVIRIDGTVEGGDGAAAAVDLAGGGSVTVTDTGRVNTNENGAAAAFRVSGGTYQVAVYAAGTALTKSGVNEAIARAQGIVIANGGSVTTRPDADGNMQPGSVSYAVVEMAGDYTTGRYVNLALDGGNPMTQGNDVYAGLRDCLDPAQVLRNGACETPTTMTPAPPPTPMVDPPFSCDMAGERCRLYEALPSMLLAMNGLPTYGERMSAPRDAKGSWARVEAASGKWEANGSTRPNVAYDHRRHGLRAGMDLMADESGRLGLSVHGLRGEAEMASVGEVETSASGLGVHATAFSRGGFHVDVQTAMTWYDVDLKSSAPTPRALKSGVKGRGYAVGVETGRRVSAAGGGVAVTPRAGLEWSKVALDGFTEEGMSANVSVDDAESLKGRAGVSVETASDGGAGGRLFGSMDLEQEFSEETAAKVSGTALEATAEATQLRFAAGGDYRWGAGRYALRSAVSYATGGGGNHDFGAGVNFAMRF